MGQDTWEAQETYSREWEITYSPVLETTKKIKPVILLMLVIHMDYRISP